MNDDCLNLNDERNDDILTLHGEVKADCLNLHGETKDEDLPLPGEYVQAIESGVAEEIVCEEPPCAHLDEVDSLDEIAAGDDEDEIVPWDLDEKRSLVAELLRCKRRLDELEERIRALEDKK